MRNSISRLLAVLALWAIVAAAAPISPTSAGGTSSFNQIYDSTPLSVSGDFEPLVGYRECTSGPSPAFPFIVWYASGSAPDYLWTFTDLGFEGDPEYTSSPLSISGDYEPVIADFDGDGCDDILWYAPGPAADYVWYFDHDGDHTSVPVTINGDYTAIGGFFTNDDYADVFFYSPGSGNEYLWRGAANRTFDSMLAPSVNGSYEIQNHDSSILFHAPGPAPDYIWDDIDHPSGQPGTNLQTQINGDYELIRSTRMILYAAGGATDYMVTDLGDDGQLTTLRGSVSGNYTVGQSSPYVAPIIVWHAPGPNTDYLWIGFS